ncbi:MAG: hypothetical protein OEM82_13010 [Acidobacteriota bacterium]|nr:hypothetical protein [Acidobacteriota bacterium]MDH3531192.1 hypothetical protein [Acidobacteriota bacterium]
MIYRTEDEIRGVIEAFEDCTVKRGDWGHPEHLILAYHYSINNDFDDAYKKMKTGIFNLLRAFEVDLSKEMPYHETMTIFWLKTVYEYATENPVLSVEVVNEMIARFDKFYPDKFYSREILMSDKARAEYVEPDLTSIDDL